MNAPRWCRALLRRLAVKGREDEVEGDLEESHRVRAQRRGPLVAKLLTVLETLDVAFALLRERLRPGMSTLDFKLGLRMLIRYPGLTALGGLALAFAIFVGAGMFEFLAQVAYPRVPLPDGDRIVGIRLWDTYDSDGESRVAWDFVRWQDEVRSLEHLGAYATVVRNLVTEDGPGTPIQMAEISASAFAMARVPPRLGRWLQEEDQQPTAEPVAVLGYDVWQERLGGDPDVVGAVVRLGGRPTTIVGVMPEGFRFPVAHDGWIPLPASLAGYGPLEGPSLGVFGRLVPGASRREAQVELEGMGRQAAAAQPRTHERLEPEVLPWPQLILDIPRELRAVAGPIVASTNIPVVLFLLLVGGNVALLMFARVAAREGEMVVRTALGASRRRIVAQLFTEGLVLATAAAVVGLALVGYGLRAGYRLVESEVLEGAELPFWFHPSLSPSTVLYVALLTVLAAAVVGVLPAMKVTDGLRDRLQSASAGGGGFRFGGVWTALIVAQIAVTCVAPLFTVAVWSESRGELARSEIGISAEEYLGARLELDREQGPDVDPDSAQARFQQRYRASIEDIEERLTADSRVAGVTFTQRLPRSYHPWNQIEVDGPSAAPPDERGHRLGRATVEVDFFRTLGAEILQGRDFHSGDLEADARAVIVNQSFVDRILGGRNPIGRHFRYLANESNRDPDQEPGPWHEIVGVVEDIGAASGYGPQGVYHPARAADIYPVNVLVHIPRTAETYGSALLAAAQEVDPGLRLRDMMTLAAVTDSTKTFYRFWFTLLIVLTSIALVLSLGGIYAVMSFTVTQRTREIGIRIALGSSRSDVVTSILRRPVAQVVLGVMTGVAVMALMLVVLGERFQWRDLTLLAGYAAIMLGVCMTASVVPVRRVMKLEVRDALGVEG